MKTIILFLLLVFCIKNVFAQNAFQLFRSNVGLLSYNYNDTNGNILTSIGTGTIISKPTNQKRDSAYFFIVTNKHVLPEFKKSKFIEFKIANPDSSKSLFTKLKLEIYDSMGKYNAHVLTSMDEDLAIIEFSGSFIKTELNSKKHFLFGIDYLATYSDLRSKSINVGDMVFFQGYPSFFYEEDNITPVFRTGFLATDPSKPFHFNGFLRNYIGRNILNGFLIDANVFGGSSGSLVCLYPTLVNQTLDNHPELVPTKGTAWILGILTESYFDIGTEKPFSQRLNIGGVISSVKILELINSYKYVLNDKSSK